MAFESGSQGSGLLGRVFSAIGSSKKPNLQHTALSPQGDTGYANLFKDYNALLGNQTAGLQDFTSQYKALTPQLAGLDQLHANTYGNLLAQAANYDPTKNYQSTGNYLFGNLDKYLNTGLQAGTDTLKRNLAAAGYGDRGPSAYSDILNANRISSNLLPAFNNIVSNLTPVSAQQNNDYFRNIAIQPGLMEGQTNALQATPFRALVPSQIQGQQLQSNLGTLNDLVKGQLNNWNFYVKPNAWQTAGNVASGVYGGIFDAADAANKVSSAYGNMMTSGLGGMGGGGGAPNLGGASNLSQLNTGQFPGESVGNPQATAAFVPTSSVYQPGYGATYGGIAGLSAYNPNSSAYSQLYQPPNYAAQYGYAPSPYSQYGGYFQ